MGSIEAVPGLVGRLPGRDYVGIQLVTHTLRRWPKTFYEAVYRFLRCTSGGRRGVSNASVVLAKDPLAQNAQQE